MTGDHHKVKCCTGSHLKKSSFRLRDLSPRRPPPGGGSLSRIVARVWGVGAGSAGAPPSTSSTVVAVHNFCSYYLRGLAGRVTK